MTRDELLLKLRDIQAPVEPPWWLLAPAWLWLAGGLATALAIAWWWHRRRRNGRLTRLAQERLRAIRREYERDGDARQFAYRASAWLRQVALLAYPERHLQSVSGDAWLQLLDAELDSRPFSQGCGRLFGHRLYRPGLDFDVDEIFALCEHWLLSIEGKLHSPGLPA